LTDKLSTAIVKGANPSFAEGIKKACTLLVSITILSVALPQELVAVTKYCPGALTSIVFEVSPVDQRILSLLYTRKISDSPLQRIPSETSIKIVGINPAVIIALALLLPQLFDAVAV
jgi:hypothetical protein